MVNDEKSLSELVEELVGSDIYNYHTFPQFILNTSKTPEEILEIRKSLREQRWYIVALFSQDFVTDQYSNCVTLECPNSPLMWSGMIDKHDGCVWTNSMFYLKN